MKVLIVGGGNMGFAYAKCLIAKNIVKRSGLYIVELNSKRARYLKTKLGCAISDGLTPRNTKVDVIILAVKPQDMATACRALRAFTRSNQLIISVMAGIRIASIQKLIGRGSRVVRCMPNLSAQIQRGVTAFYIPRNVPKNLAKMAKIVLGSTGTAVNMGRESLMDQATAVSGCGPAYVFYLIEHLMGAARELGFSYEQSRTLVFETFIGATHLWHQSGETPEILRERVTSKKGATYAAFQVFSNGKVGETLRAGIKAANRRSKELSRFASFTHK